MITQRNDSVENRPLQEDEFSSRKPAKNSSRNENPDLLFNRLTLGMIKHERRKRRGRSIRRMLCLLLVLAGLCGAWGYYLGDPRTFDWVGLWRSVPWPAEQTS